MCSSWRENRNLRLRKNNKSSINLSSEKNNKSSIVIIIVATTITTKYRQSPGWDNFTLQLQAGYLFVSNSMSDQTFAEKTMLFKVFVFFAGRCPMPTTKFMYQVWGANGLRKETSNKAKKAGTTRSKGSLDHGCPHSSDNDVMLLSGGRGPHYCWLLSVALNHTRWVKSARLGGWRAFSPGGK